MSHLTRLCILGSTGSIGRSTLDVVRRHRSRFRVEALSCSQNLDLLSRQVKEFLPSVVAVSAERIPDFREMVRGQAHQPRILANDPGNETVATDENVDVVVAAVAGAVGIVPIAAAIRSGKRIAIANKEPIVLAGELLTREARERGSQILPIDSEHNAIFQCLRGSDPDSVEGITLTASGGPFLRSGDFERITKAEALRHPNWSMGEKVTIDSATMMNKALEIIEARWLFDMPPEKIKVLIHPQSIIHSMAHFIDGSTMCQMGSPDMRVPIAYCLGADKRMASGVKEPDWSRLSPLEFLTPDRKRFPSLDFAFEALRLGKGAPAFLNGANEYVVSAFLAENISMSAMFHTLGLAMRHLGALDAGDGVPEVHSIQDAIGINNEGATFAAERVNAGNERMT